MANIYKPRYKICYQLKNKVWINKNSKISGFNNLRSSRTNILFARRRLKSMKWVTIRRFLIPRIRNRSRAQFHYKNMFQKKQQVKKFYGHIKEYQLQHIFKDKWKQQKSFKQNIFVSILEKRLDVLLYRVKIFPTIFACNQFICHQGININGNLVKNINYPLKYGDIITFNENHWELIYDRLYEKLINRESGHDMLSSYYYKNFIQINNNIRRKKPFKNKFKLAHEIRKLKFRYIKLTRILTFLKAKKAYSPEKLQVLSEIAYIKVGSKIDTINVLTSSFNKQNESDYIKFEQELILAILSAQKYINKFIYLYKVQQVLLLNLKKPDVNVPDLLQKHLNDYKIKNTQLINVAKIFFLKGNFNAARKFIKYKNRKKKFITNIGRNIAGFYKKPHWYIPRYIEVDYNTLQLSFINQPNNNEIFYPFFFSFDELVTFYRYKGL